MKKFLLGCLGVAVLGMIVIVVVGAVLYRQTPVLSASLDAPAAVPLDTEFTLVVTATNPHAKPVTLDSIDIQDSFLEGFQVLGVEPEPKSTQHLFTFRTWDFGKKIPAGAAEQVRFQLKAIQAGHFSGDIDVCNVVQKYTTVVGDIVVKDDAGEQP